MATMRASNVSNVPDLSPSANSQTIQTQDTIGRSDTADMMAVAVTPRAGNGGNVNPDHVTSPSTSAVPIGSLSPLTMPGNSYGRTPTDHTMANSLTSAPTDFNLNGSDVPNLALNGASSSDFGNGANYERGGSEVFRSPPMTPKASFELPALSERKVVTKGDTSDQEIPRRASSRNKVAVRDMSMSTEPPTDNPVFIQKNSAKYVGNQLLQKRESGKRKYQE